MKASAMRGIFTVQLLLLLGLTVSVLAQERGWEEDWNNTLRAAKKEGKVVMAGPPNTVVRRELPAAFTKKFGITVEYLGARGSQTAAKVMMERRAGLYAVDAVVSGVNTARFLYQGKALDSVRAAFILPEVLNPSNWKVGKLWFIDTEEKYILRLLSYKSGVLYINTSLVKPGDLESMKDLLDPKWKGKISVFDPTVRGGGTGTAAMLLRQFGEDFVKRLYVDQKPVISRSTRQISEWLARGTYPISLNGSTSRVKRMQADGLPVKVIYDLPDVPGEITTGTGTLLLLDRAPHPNAARVFVNWMASREGLEVYARAYGHSTTRNDIDETSFLHAEEIPRPGVNYFDSDSPASLAEEEKAKSFMKRLLQSR